MSTYDDPPLEQTAPPMEDLQKGGGGSETK